MNNTKQLTDFNKFMDANLRQLRKLHKQLKCKHDWNYQDPTTCNNCGIKVSF